MLGAFNGSMENCSAVEDLDVDAILADSGVAEQAPDGQNAAGKARRPRRTPMPPNAMTQTTLNHWARNYPREIQNSPPEWLLGQALACAKLTRMEMDVLVAGGLQESQAWSEARSLFCLARAPKYDQQSCIGVTS